MRRTTLAEFFQWFPDGIYGQWIAGEKCYVWNEKATGLRGRVYFMGVEDESDASKIASMPLAGFAIDEPSPAAGSSSGVAEFVFDTAFAQLRQPGMQWYAAKLAQNNPDETHWTYRRFWEPGTPGVEGAEMPPMQESGFRGWQPAAAENIKNLPAGYYEKIKRGWKHRPDLLRRFVEGKHGYQQVGKAVTPGWNDDLHLAYGLEPVAGLPLHLLWDGGLNPTCIITQITPLGYWNVLDAAVGDGIGAYELIGDVVKPIITTRYRGFELKHTGDPMLSMREQSSSLQSAERVIRKELGGGFIPGPVKIDQRVEPLRAVLTKVRQGRGVLQVDRDRAKAVWHALRGGWHYHITRTGGHGEIKKDIHSHPGDCMGYGAALLFPLGQLRQSGKVLPSAKGAGGYFNTSPGTMVPKEARTIGGTEE